MAKKSGKAALPDMLARSGKIGAGELSEAELDGVSGGTTTQDVTANKAQVLAEAQTAAQSKIASAAKGVNPFVPQQ